MDKVKECKFRNCSNTVSGQKQYCSERCKYWENNIRKDEERHLPPVKKRTKDWMYMHTGNSVRASNRGQGKRVGYMVTGSMSAMIYMPEQQLVPTTIENIESHFKSRHLPNVLILGDGTRLAYQEAVSLVTKKPLSVT